MLCYPVHRQLNWGIGWVTQRVEGHAHMSQRLGREKLTNISCNWSRSYEGMWVYCEKKEEKLRTATPELTTDVPKKVDRDRLDML